MRKITIETILTALFEYGFEKVDPVLFTMVLSKLAQDDANKQEIEFVFDIRMCKAFIKEGTSYKLNEDMIDRKLWFKYHSDRKLKEYIESMNFEDMISKKLEAYGYKKIDYMLGKEKIDETYFSKKELEIINSMINKSNNAFNKIIEERKRQSEVKENMISNNDYIEWIIKFAKENNNQFYDDDYKNREDIDHADREGVRDLHIFFDIVSEYADQNKCKDGYYCKIKYNEEVLNIGILHGLTVTHFVSLASKTDELGNPKIGYDIGATDYKEIIEKYKKYNRFKVYKKD